MDFPADLFVKPVKDHDDLIAFQYDFVLDGKALEDGAEQTVTELDNGDLIIEGYAAVFDGLDRQNENFAEGAFQRGIKSFLSGQSALCYHHKHDQCLGKVIDLQEEEGKGLKMKARVDGAIRNHPTLGTYYQQIKNGTLNALSVGGFFKRALTKAGKKIVDMDFTEISVTPVPVHPGTSFNVVAGKALVSDLKPERVQLPQFPEEEVREEDFEMATVAINILDGLFARLEKRGEEQSTSGAVTTI